eukprot:TRINITY_DN9393_c0_g1_i1.p1 TRINITY_DN9393_c0_g1~~TRINITY_DN9393_c0_g1_i1.p1  ORF type:complete len:781 (-),score=136.46 TRINITY_DN9393_c0_g1_i1:645-2987(-)
MPLQKANFRASTTVVITHFQSDFGGSHIALSSKRFRQFHSDFGESHVAFSCKQFRPFACRAFVLVSYVQHLQTEFPEEKRKTTNVAYSGTGVQLKASNAKEDKLGDEFSVDSLKSDTKELEDFPEEWRRRKIAWLCKHLVGRDSVQVVELLNKQRKWIQMEDSKYIINHFLRLRENNTSYSVYRWMTRQTWFAFDFSLATKLADYLAKDLKIIKSRDIFDDIINRDHVPSESTFTLLILAYIEVSGKCNVDEACAIYNKMINLGGHRPPPMLQSKLFRSLLKGSGGIAKTYLQQAELLFGNLQSAGNLIKQDIYEGLIWLHSYQYSINRERIESLRNEMKQKGYKESHDLLVSILRVSAAYGDVDEAEKIWLKILDSRLDLCSQAYVYRMIVYAKAGKPMKSLDVFMEMKESKVPVNVIAYHKIIQIMSIFHEIEHAENLMKEYEESGLKSLQSSYIELMQMYMRLSMFDKVELTFSRCKLHCQPNRDIYNTYIESLIELGKLKDAGELFEDLIRKDIRLKVTTYNLMLEAFLKAGENIKAKAIYSEMICKRYDVNPTNLELLKSLIGFDPRGDINIANSSLKLMAEHRDIVVALLLSGAKVAAHDEKKAYAVQYDFRGLKHKNVLQKHLFEAFYEWLNPADQLKLRTNEMPSHFSTIYHTNFCYYADQFRPGGQMKIPHLIHRWLSSRVLAYWYMYGGCRSSGDIIFLVKNYNSVEIQLIANSLKKQAINCQVRRRQNLFQIRFQGSNARELWNLTKSYVIEELQEILKPQETISGRLD